MNMRPHATAPTLPPAPHLCVVVERPRRRYARRRRRRLEVWGLLPDSRRIVHFLLPAVVPRAGEHGSGLGLI